MKNERYRRLAQMCKNLKGFLCRILGIVLGIVLVNFKKNATI